MGYADTYTQPQSLDQLHKQLMNEQVAKDEKPYTHEEYSQFK